MNNYNKMSKSGRCFDVIRDRTGGFTLIELLVAIAFFVGLSVLAIPSIRGLVDNFSGKRAVHEIISDLYTARTLAIRYGQNCTVNFSYPPGPAQYTVNWTDANGAAQTKTVYLSSFRHGVRFDNAPPGAITPPADNQVVFTPLGFATNASNTYITDQDNVEVIRIRIANSGAIGEMRWIAASNQWIFK